MADNNMYTEKLQQGKKARAGIVSCISQSKLSKRFNILKEAFLTASVAPSIYSSEASFKLPRSPKSTAWQAQ